MKKLPQDNSSVSFCSIPDESPVPLERGRRNRLQESDVSPALRNYDRYPCAKQLAEPW